MENSLITVRDARPEDAAGVARLLIMAWPVEDFLSRMPSLDEESFAEFISGFVASQDNLYSYEVTKVAVLTSEDGTERIVGMMNGYDGAQYKALKQPVLDAMSRDFDSGRDFGAVTETEAGEFYLDSAGVDPSMRSMGIGSKLFETMLARASDEGFKVAGLIVDEDKPKAEALYLRLGFKTVGFRDFLGHRMKHMQINL